MFNKISHFTLFLAFLFINCKNETVNKKGENIYQFYIGTYTQKEGHVDGKGEGVYKIAIDMDTDSLKIVDVIGDMVNPSFLAISNDEKHIYAVNELGENPQNYNARLSHITVVDSTGKHRKAQEAGMYGLAACHVALNPKGNMYAVVNYMRGELAYGKLGPNGNFEGEIFHKTTTGKSYNTARQEASHLHMSAFLANGARLITADLGTDSLRVYNVDETTGNLNQINAFGTKPGDGPRHFTTSSDEKIIYVINELSNTISSYSFEALNGALNLLNTVSTLPKEFTETNNTADIHLSNDGKYLYGSNRGHNSIVSFSLDGKGGMNYLSHTSTEGKTPRNFALTKDGKYMLVGNQDSDNITVFNIGLDGKLTKKASHSIKTPVCIKEVTKK